MRRYAEGFYGVGNYPPDKAQGVLRTNDVFQSFCRLALHHLGFVKLDSSEAEAIVNRGFDVVIDYFFGTWWRDYPEDGEDVNKSHRHLNFAECFFQGLQLGLLSERWNDVAKVCGWVEANLKETTDVFAEDWDDGVLSVYKSIAAGLRPEPMKGLKKLEEQVMQSRTQKPRLLFQAWNAARSGDQAEFEKYLTKSLQHFVTNIPHEPYAWEAVALHASVVCGAGRHLGMKLPPLPPKLDAVLMTRESLGMSPSSK